MRYTIKESQLHKIIAESVKKVLKEHGRGNNLANREDWNNFEDPLLHKGKMQRELVEMIEQKKWVINFLKNIRGQHWFKVLSHYSITEPTVSFHVFWDKLDRSSEPSNQFNYRFNVGDALYKLVEMKSPNYFVTNYGMSFYIYGDSPISDLLQEKLGDTPNLERDDDELTLNFGLNEPGIGHEIIPRLEALFKNNKKR